jgi:hypothetical protein
MPAPTHNPPINEYLLVFNTLFDLEVWGLFYFILVGFSGVRK